MADHRTPFRPRRLAIGMALVLLGAISAHAQEAGLKNGAAALNAGKYDNAVRLLSATVNSEGAAPSEAAKRFICAASPIASLASPRARSPILGPPFGSGCRGPTA